MEVPGVAVGWAEGAGEAAAAAQAVEANLEEVWVPPPEKGAVRSSILWCR